MLQGENRELKVVFVILMYFNKYIPCILHHSPWKVVWFYKTLSLDGEYLFDKIISRGINELEVTFS